MQRYHNKVYFPANSETLLEVFTQRLNNLNFVPTLHCIDNLKHRVIDLENLLNHIKGIELKAEAVFEYYIEGNNIIKACYRLPYNGNDIILVLSENKDIVTIYLNESTDNHVTLNYNLYMKK